MKAVGYSQSLAISEANALIDIELPQPKAVGHDLLVKINAIAVNPVDCKIRQRKTPDEGQYTVLGWDAVGEVMATGEHVTLFTPGDRVFYAGDLNRQGSNAEFQLVDERLVGKKPHSLSDVDSAALPLTTITAWELLFEHLAIQQQAPEDNKKSADVILVVGAAGGVGSLLIQLAKVLTGATVIATASRPSSQDWVKKLGADYVVNHCQPLLPQIEALGLKSITHIASLNNTEEYFEQYTELLAPFGKIAMIDDLKKPLDIIKLKPKSQSLHIEFMFARSLFKTADMAEQGRLLNRVADLVDQGLIQSTRTKTLGTLCAGQLKIAHETLESRTVIGKLVLHGF